MIPGLSAMVIKCGTFFFWVKYGSIFKGDIICLVSERLRRLDLKIEGGREDVQKLFFFEFKVFGYVGQLSFGDTNQYLISPRLDQPPPSRDRCFFVMFMNLRPASPRVVFATFA